MADRAFSFPKLVVDPDDPEGSLRMYSDNWKRAVVMFCFLKGKSGTGKAVTRSEAFPADVRIALFRAAVGDEANEILNDQDFREVKTGDDEDNGAVERALIILERHYCRESEASKSFKYLGARQMEGESTTAYLDRMTKLARRAGMHRSEDRVLRAVYGLSDTSLQRKLLIKLKETEEIVEVFDWDCLTSYVRIHCAVDEVDKPCRPVTGKDQSTGGSEVTTKPTVVTTVPTPVGDESGGKTPVVAWASDESRHGESRPRSDSRDRGRDRDRGFRDRGYPRDSRPRDYSRDSYDRFQRRDYEGRNRGREYSPYQRRDRYDSRDRYDRDSRPKSSYRSPSEERSFERRRDDSDPRRVRFREDERRSAQRTRSVTCDLCGEQGHFMRRCPDIVCKLCKGRGHVMSDCGRKPERRSQARAVTDRQVVSLVDRTEDVSINDTESDSD